MGSVSMLFSTHHSHLLSSSSGVNRLSWAKATDRCTWQDYWMSSPNNTLNVFFGLHLSSAAFWSRKVYEKSNYTICKLLRVNPITSAADERSFSSARGLKKWLRSTMTQTRFSNLTMLNTHTQRTDNLCLYRCCQWVCSSQWKSKKQLWLLQRIRLTNDRVTFNRCVCWV